MGILAGVALTANTNNTVYTEPAGAGHTVNVLISNNNPGISAYVSMWVVQSGGSVGNLWRVEANTLLGPGIPLERGAIPLAAGDFIVINPSVSGVSAIVVGLQ